jgi:hypothetical protein
MSDYSYLTGHRFTGGTYRLEAHVAWLWGDAALDRPEPPRAHPSLAYVMAMRGCIDISELFRLLGTDSEAGVLFGECELAFEQPLAVGCEYELEGEILSVERKHGRRSGPFDRVRFQVRVHEAPGGRSVCTNTNTWMIPRRVEAS